MTAPEPPRDPAPPRRFRPPGTAACAVLALVAVFLLSRLALALSGVAMDTLPLAGAWQLIDPALLRGELLTSVFHLHTQPPLFNLFAGLLTKLFPDLEAATRAMDLVYIVLGLALALILYGLLRQLQAGPRASAAATVVFILSPATVLYENFAHYTYPTALLLALCALLFARTTAAFTPWRVLALFMAMAALIYLRSLFQVHWFLVLAGFCIWVLPGRRRQVALAAVLPLLLVGGLYAKNAAITGQWTTSTWLGMSLAKLTTSELSKDERLAMISDGTLSPLAAVKPYSALSEYPYIADRTPTTGVAVLDRENKSTGPENFHHLAYAAISAQYLADAVTVIRQRPEVYLESVSTALQVYFRPAGDFPFLADNRQRIEPLARPYNRLLAGQPAYPAEPDFDRPPADQLGYLVVAGFLLCLVYGLVPAARVLRRPSTASRTDVLLVFLWLNVVYVTVVGNAFEMGENQRFRFLVNPLLTAMLVAIALHGAQGARRLWERHRLSVASSA